MPFPIIVINSATGSDTQASGSPSTLAALYGSRAATTAASGSVDLSADAPNLSGVPVDGSAALWLELGTERQFYKITGVNNTTKVVTVSPNVDVSRSTVIWAIGGKRASLTTATLNDLLASWELRVEVPTSPPAIAGMTGKDLVDAVRLELDDPDIQGQQPRWSAAEILSVINEAYESMCATYELIRSTVTLPLVAGTRTYQLPANVVSVSSVVRLPENYALHRATKMELDLEFPNWQSVSGTPRAYYVEQSNSIGFYPMPSVAVTVVLDVWALPSVALTLSGVPAFHRRYHRALVHLAASLLAATDASSEYRVAQASVQLNKFLLLMKGVATFKWKGMLMNTGAASPSVREKPLQTVPAP